MRRLLDDEHSLEEQIGKRFDEMSQKWQEVQEAHDLYTQELSEEQVKTEEKCIEEIEVSGDGKAKTGMSCVFQDNL